jgi:AraC family transcriptional activator of pobA
MNKNYKSERTVNYYANRANLSKGHFSRIIKNRTGKTPSQWIATVTIVNAKLMLEQSGNSIKEIAAELNFPEQFTFRKYFKQHVGVPPKEYRALKRNSRTNEQQG